MTPIHTMPTRLGDVTIFVLERVPGYALTCPACRGVFRLAPEKHQVSISPAGRVTVDVPLTCPNPACSWRAIIEDGYVVEEAGEAVAATSRQRKPMQIRTILDDGSGIGGMLMTERTSVRRSRQELTITCKIGA